MTKILIGVPGFAGIQPESQENFMRMIFRLGRDTEHDIIVSIITKAEQFRARNTLVGLARESGADYLLMLDDDMIVPPDLLQRLMAHDKDVVGALYYQRGGSYHPVVMKMRHGENGDFSCSFLSGVDPILTQPGLHPVDIIGGGCMLFKVSVFDKLLEPIFWWEAKTGTDIQICRRLKEVGFQPYIDTTIELGHMGEKTVVNSRTIPLEGRIMQEANEVLYEDLKEYLQLNDEQLIFEMDKAIDPGARARVWNEKDRSDWQGIKEYYQEASAYHLTNLAHFNLRKHSQIKSWALMPNNPSIKSYGVYLDYGSGLGHLAIPLAEKTSSVWGFDIEGSPTLEFYRWRSNKHRRGNYWFPLTEELPTDTFTNTLDGAFMISTIEHLTKPLEVIEWITSRVRKGGFFACDWFFHGSNAEEPQHLEKHDPHHFPEWMQKHGWEMSPEHLWLFIKKE